MGVFEFTDVKMKRGLVLIVCLFAFQIAASDVVDLDSSNFDSYVNPSTNALVEFFAPWCGHCKSLAPEYEIVGSAYKRFSSEVVVAKVDCTEQQDLCAKYEVSGYPTLKWFGKSAEPSPYSGARTAEGIIEFINQATGLKAKVPGAVPSRVVSLTESSFVQYVNPGVNALVKFFAPWCGHCKRMAPDYEKLALAYANEPDVVIAEVDCTEQPEVCNAHGVSGYPTLKWFARGSNEPSTYESGRDLEAFVEFINENAGTNRLASGMLNENAGLVYDLNVLIAEFNNDKAGTLAKAKEIAQNLDNSISVKTYIRAFEKLVDDSSYASKEIARLERMLSSGSVKAEKVDEFVKRVNVLKQFSKE